jgi:hypothetical protein
VTPTSPAGSSDPAVPVTGPTPRVASWCGSSFLSGPDLPPASRWSIGVLKVTWWYEHQEALRVEVVMTPTSSGQLLRLPPPPSSGRRRELPRGVELSLLSGSRPTSGKPAVVRIQITSGRSLR